MSTTETRVDATTTIDRPSGPGGDPGDAPEEARTSHWRRAAGFGLPVALVGAFIAFGWTAEWFREGLGWLAPHVAILLWAAVAAVLGYSLIRRIVHRNLVSRGPRSFGFLLAPSALAGCVIAYLVELFGSWNNGGAAWWTVGGVVPFSDAMAYVGGAQRMLFDGQLDQFNSRRPLHATFLASELAFTNFDLRTVLVIQAVLLGVASYLAARTIARDLGPLAGLALFAGIYGFARVGVQTASTETMGVTMGALAFAALWSAVRRRNIWLAAGGVFLLTFALNFRPGPILLLLTLPLAFAWLLRGSARVNWRVLGLSVAAVIVGLATNYVAIATFHGDAENLNANANYIIYGMAKGFPGWTEDPPSWNRIDIDHPEIIEMSETARNRFVTARAREELRAHPGTFAKSYVEGAGNYFRASADYVMEPVPSGLLRLLVYAAALVLAAVVLIARWRTSSRRVLLDVALFGGVMLALPSFVGAWPYGDEAPWGWGTVGAGSYFPWWFGAAVGALAYVAFILVGTERLRVDRQLGLVVVALASIAVIMPVLGYDTTRLFAAAVPFLALSFALAVAVIERGPLPKRAPVTAPAAPKQESRTARWAPVLIGVVVAAVAVIGAPIAGAAIDKPATPARTCPDGRRAETLMGGSAVRLVEPSAKSDLDELDVDHVTSSPVTKWLQKEGVFPPINANMTFLGGLSQRGYDRFAFVDGAVSAPGRSVLYLCGATISDSVSNGVLRWSAVPVDVVAGTPIDATSTPPVPARQP
jgi:hypothetical protein